MLNILGVSCILLITIQGVLSNTHNHSCPLDDEFDDSYIGITLSANPGKRELQIIWSNKKFRTGDKIHVLNHEPKGGFREIYSFSPLSPSGVDKPGITHDLNDGNPASFVKKCLRYYVAWVRGGWIRQISCLGTEPTWMNDRIEMIEDLTLKQLFIPGTHNSGSHEVDSTYGIFRTVLEPYAITQNLHVLDQLIYGARYLDIRVSYYPDDEISTWWVNNLAIRSTPLQNIINQVKLFLRNTNEVVIFDVQDFPIGFESRATYLKLVNHLMKEFEDHLIPHAHNWSTPLSEIFFKTNKRLVLTFNRSAMPVWFKELWPSIKHKSTDSSEFEDLFTHLESTENPQFPEQGLAPKAAIAQLALRIERSPTDNSIIGPSPGLADLVNTAITQWYHQHWMDVANIVAVDYITGSGIVEMAIKSNEKRSHNYKKSFRSESCFPIKESEIPELPAMMDIGEVEELLFPFVAEHAAQRIYSILAHTIL